MLMKSAGVSRAALRPAAVAGRFYPSDAAALAAAVRAYLDLAYLPAVVRESRCRRPIKALIAPHAGYVYSGPVAGSAYRCLQDRRNRIDRVVLAGPSHFAPLSGIAVSTASGFRTPLGVVPVDRQAVEGVLAFPQVVSEETAHAAEHSLEVHLPFLQVLLERFSLVPLVVGAASPDEVSEVFDALWGGEETLIVVSSDLSHYNDYETARNVDAVTSRAIEALDAAALTARSACGQAPLRGLLLAARRHGLEVHALDLRNSGDTAGPRSSVVGYGAYCLR